MITQPVLFAIMLALYGILAWITVTADELRIPMRVASWLGSAVVCAALGSLVAVLWMLAGKVAGQ